MFLAKIVAKTLTLCYFSTIIILDFYVSAFYVLIDDCLTDFKILGKIIGTPYRCSNWWRNYMGSRRPCPRTRMSLKETIIDSRSLSLSLSLSPLVASSPNTLSCWEITRSDVRYLARRKEDQKCLKTSLFCR